MYAFLGGRRGMAVGMSGYFSVIIILPSKVIVTCMGHFAIS